MDATEQDLRAYIETVLMERVAQNDAERRAEALRDYLTVSRAAADNRTAEELAGMIPPVLPALYRKWIRMFIKKLFETATAEQIATLCDGTAENAAALLLAYLMFLESERMERQVLDDLRSLGESQSAVAEGPDQADVAATYIRARVAQLAAEMKKAN
jgi:hypothetical protein